MGFGPILVPTTSNKEVRSPQTPTTVTAPNFHPVLYLPCFALTQRLVCHLCHKHCVWQQMSTFTCSDSQHKLAETSVWQGSGQTWAIPDCTPPAPHQRFVSKEQLHLFAWQKCHGNKTVCTNPVLSGDAPGFPLRAPYFTLRQLFPAEHAERFPHEYSLLQCLKWLMLIQCGHLILFFGGAFTGCYSQPAQNTKRIYSRVPA